VCNEPRLEWCRPTLIVVATAVGLLCDLVHQPVPARPLQTQGTSNPSWTWCCKRAGETNHCSTPAAPAQPVRRRTVSARRVRSQGSGALPPCTATKAKQAPGLGLTIDVGKRQEVIESSNVLVAAGSWPRKYKRPDAL
jgi:hypothetical protein